MSELHLPLSTPVCSESYLRLPRSANSYKLGILGLRDISLVFNPAVQHRELTTLRLASGHLAHSFVTVTCEPHGTEPIFQSCKLTAYLQGIEPSSCYFRAFS